MNSAPDNTWRSDFGIDNIQVTSFFGSKRDLDLRNVSVPHAHVIRRAFDLLDLDGVLCDQTSPIVYFKVVPQIQTAGIHALHRRFWNHGGAPILVVVSPLEVQVYSGLSRPTYGSVAEDRSSGLVTTIIRASSALRDFLPSVESGEFFRAHPRSFEPSERVDRALLDNLRATREKLTAIATKKATADILDAFLCRLVFTCYLFDREVIGESYLRDIGLCNISHLRDVLGREPRSEAKASLYRLFRKLENDFNGDLFSDDLEAESAFVTAAHIEVVDAFFRGTDVSTGQQAFWPYDFGAIPIETISAIYERFLKSSDKQTGAFYTPRFLAELVLDMALSKSSSLLGLRFLDPACGSGIFLVGLFNRIAEEWKRANPRASNDRRARELGILLRSSIFGIDLNPTACRITAFSLYLAYLDQLSPRDIQELQLKGRALPRLVNHLDHAGVVHNGGGIWCGDFFHEDAPYPMNIDMVVGNPPWGSIAGKGSAAAEWLHRRQYAIPDGQIAAAFMWKAAEHAASSGRICFVLPHGILFNHSQAALSFQKLFVRKHALDRVLNLTDYQSFLFSEARHPALVLSYRKNGPTKDHTIEYWAPKTDWKALKAEIITVSEQDRSTLTLPSILQDLDGEDAPQIWKRMSWATSRDRRLLDRLSELPRLRDIVGQARERPSKKPWLIAEGFQPLGENDDHDRATVLELPSDLFIRATSPNLRLFLLENDCVRLRSTRVKVRARSNKVVEIFDGPHVLVAKGFGSIAFANFAVSFRHALRGIKGPTRDRKLLVFLAAYMGSSLAKYFQFHTSSNWGVSRQEVHVEELLRLPFPLPGAVDDPMRGESIIEKVADIVQSATREARRILVDRNDLADRVQAELEPLVYEYFDVIPSERVLVEDTVRIAIESFRPSPHRRHIPAIEPSTHEDRLRYTNRLCNSLNGWAQGGQAKVVGSAAVSYEIGVGLVTLQKVGRGNPIPAPIENGSLIVALDKLRDAASLKTKTFEMLRGIKVFDGSRLYLLKPLGLSNWSETAALNDADAIAGSILMQSPEKLS